MQTVTQARNIEGSPVALHAEEGNQEFNFRRQKGKKKQVPKSRAKTRSRRGCPPKGMCLRLLLGRMGRQAPGG